MSPELFTAFADEMVKISAAKNKMRVAQSRKGRRPMRVDTMLRKEKDGTLYKFTKGAQLYSDQSSLEYTEGNPRTGRPATAKKKKGDVPSREDLPSQPMAVNRQDITETKVAPGTTLHDIALGGEGYGSSY